MNENPPVGHSRQPTPIIALTHEFFPDYGGIATYVQEVARAVTDNGRLIEVWAPGKPKMDRPRFPFVVRELPVKGSQSWPCRIRLAIHLQQRRSAWRDLVCYLPEPGPIITWMYLQLLQDVPSAGLVVTLHGTEINRFARPFHRRLLFHRLLRRAHRIGVVSNYVKSLLIEQFPEFAPKVVLAPGAPRAELLLPIARDKERSSTSSIVLLTVARIHPRKGQLAVLEALSRLPLAMRSRIEYRIVGPVTKPDYLRRLQEFARRKGLVMRHLGSLLERELSYAYRDADIFVATSIAHRESVEGLGLAYLEASASGLPIIAHRIGGVPEAVREEETGLLIQPEDRDGLARAIAGLARAPERRRALGSAGQLWAKRFTWEATTRALFEEIG